MRKIVLEVLEKTWIHLLSVIVLAIIGTAVIVSCESLLWGDFGTVFFYVIYLVILIYTVSYNKVLYRQFVRGYGYMFVLYAAISFSLLIISIIFGLQTDFLLKYERYKNESSYAWINPVNILKFPLVQSRKKDVNMNESIAHDSIVLNKKSIDSTVNIVFIDNSLSNQKDSKTNDLILSLFDKISLAQIEVDKIKNSNQLIAPLLLNAIFRNGLSKKNDVVLYRYDGNSKSQPELISLTPSGVITKEYYKDFKAAVKSALIDSLLPERQSNQLTYLNDFFNVSGIIQKEELEEYVHKKIYFLSDFQDEGNNEDDFYSNLTSVFENESVSSVSFIRSKGRGTKPNSYLKVKAQAFGFRDKCEINELDFLADDNELINNQLKLIHLNDNQKYNSDRVIEFGYPYKNGNSNFCLEANICLNSNNDELVFCLTDLDDFNNESLIDCKLGAESLRSHHRINKPFRLSRNVNIGEPIRLSLSNFKRYEGNRLRLDIYSKRLNSVTSSCCVVLPNIPITSITLFVIFYSLLIYSLSIMFVYPQLFFVYLIRNSSLSVKDQFLKSVLPVFLMALCVVPVYYMIYLYIGSYPVISVLILISLGLITVPHYLIFLNKNKHHYITADYSLITFDV